MNKIMMYIYYPVLIHGLSPNV